MDNTATNIRHKHIDSQQTIGKVMAQRIRRAVNMYMDRCPRGVESYKPMRDDVRLPRLYKDTWDS